MSFLRLILRSLQYHLRINLAVALGVLAATAVLTGALVVGDSVRGSLRYLALDRLGKIDAVLVTDRFFRTELATELAAAPGFAKRYVAALPAVVVQGTVQNPTAEHKPRASGVTVIGSDERFWTLGSAELADVPWPKKGEVVLNQPLADKLSATVGSDVVLRIGSVSQIPADSPLGRKTETIRNQRLTVTAIIPAVSLGRFSLHPTQQMPLNAFVAAETLQAALEQPGLVNAIFVAGRDDSVPTTANGEALQAMLRPTLADYGFTIDRAKLGYLRFTSKRMMIEPAAEKAVGRTFDNEKPLAALTYLANSISLGDLAIPYSTVAALDFTREPPLGPFVNPDGDKLPPLAAGEIALNTWAVEDLGAQLGDTIELTYFEPESTHGQVQERTARFTLAGVVAMEGAGADRQLTPDLPGVTDQLAIGDWDPPFPFEADRVRKKDEQYWDDYRTTPKAYISLADGRKLWGSRFGSSTSLRWAEQGARETPDGADVATVSDAVKKLRLDPAEFGFELLSIKAMALQAASGTTPFNLLFLGFSFFIMAAALMLVALLFRLGMQQRAAEIGVLSATGMRRRKIALLLCAEGARGRGPGGRGRRGRRRWLCLADARRAQEPAVLAPGDPHAVFGLVRHADEPARGLCQRRCRVAADHSVDAARAQAPERAATAWRRVGRAVRACDHSQHASQCVARLGDGRAGRRPRERRSAWGRSPGGRVLRIGCSCACRRDDGSGRALAQR